MCLLSAPGTTSLRHQNRSLHACTRFGAREAVTVNVLDLFSYRTPDVESCLPCCVQVCVLLFCRKDGKRGLWSDHMRYTRQEQTVGDMV